MSLNKEKLTYKGAEKSEINLTNTNSTIGFNQDSFISSIPERTNDSTLVGNHHNQCHQSSANKSNKKSVQHTSESTEKNVAEIQTTTKKREAAKYASAQLNSSTTVTTTLSSRISMGKSDMMQHEKMASNSGGVKGMTRSPMSDSMPDIAASSINNINVVTALLNNQNSRKRL